VAKTLYRLVKTDPPTETDFLSQKAENRRLINKKYADEFEGVSHWDSRAGAESLSGTVKGAQFVAELSIPDGSSIRYRPSFREGHFTIWAEPDILLGLVVRIHTINSPRKES
jgi:hypothetical protein